MFVFVIIVKSLYKLLYFVWLISYYITRIFLWDQTVVRIYSNCHTLTSDQTECVSLKTKFVYVWPLPGAKYQYNPTIDEF